MSKQFPKPFNSHFGDSLKVKIDLSNYAKKTDIKNILHVDTSSFALKTNLASLKTEVDKLDIDKLAPVPVDLSKLSDAVKKDVVKKTEYDQLVGKVNNIDTSDFVLKTKYNTGKTKLENKIPNISNLATKTALTTVENKIPSGSDSVKKRDYNNKVTEIEKKFLILVIQQQKLHQLQQKIKYLVLVIQLKKQTIILKLQKLKINLITIS